jgi:DNA mismatch repair protein MutS
MALTPMMIRWQEIKTAHKDCLVFYRLGDFYEMFFEDAETSSRILGLTLTGKDCGLEKRAPMCGVPYHAAAAYIKKLIDKGYRVAICEQLTAPQKGKALVERDVVKIITSGTYCDEDFLDGEKNNFIAAVYSSAGEASVSWCDVTTGEFFATICDAAKTDDILSMVTPREVIDSNGHYGYSFNTTSAYQSILRYFKITNTEIFDIKKDSKIINSAGALLDYLIFTQKQILPNITKINVIKNGEYMILDRIARENLELNTQIRSNKKQGSLLWILDATKTAMGARKLADWLNKPLQNANEIHARHDAVEFLYNHPTTLHKLGTALSKIADISRLCGKIARKEITPRDLLSVLRTIEKFDEVKTVLNGRTQDLLDRCAEEIVLLPEIIELISKALADEPPSKTDEGGYIRVGFSAELDEYRSAGKMGRTWLSKLEHKEREETNIKELKIGFNRIAGFYFEIPTRLSSRVPYRFTRKATTATCDRYITQELKELQEKIINAELRAIELEFKLLGELRVFVLGRLEILIKNADLIAVLDVLHSFASVAVANNFTKPQLNSAGIINLKNARHPVVEKIINRCNYIANDCFMQNDTMLITGPNMAGKSTYMRMVAHVVIMSHIGSFVPCDDADIALTDRIFTRIGASDSISTGESTFMVEMNEVSNIVHNATVKSLILLDEVGRGTGTSDGRALASAVITYITGKIGANTMFATHFHQLTELAANNPRIKNYKVLVSRVGDEIVFLHKLEKGIEQNSFGIDVARLAGLPDEIIENARGLLR